jgi:hypothetical protein
MSPTIDAMTTPMAYEYRLAEEKPRRLLDPSIQLSGTWEIEPILAALHLRTLPENWDGEGSQRPTDAAVFAAAGFISAVASFSLEPPTPHLYPVPGGGAQIEWRAGERYLEIEIMPDATAHYLIALGGDPQREGAFPLWAPMQAKPLLEWLVSGVARRP